MLTGEIDRDGSLQIQQAVIDILERQQPSWLCLDLKQVTFLDSAGIRTLLQCLNQAAGRRCTLSISRVHPHVRQVLAVTSLLETFGLSPE